MERTRPLEKTYRNLVIGLVGLGLLGCASAITLDEETVLYFSENPNPITVDHEVCHQNQIRKSESADIWWQENFEDINLWCKREIECGASLTHPACSKVIFENQDKLLNYDK